MKSKLIFAAILPAAMLLLSTQISRATDVVWNLSGTNGSWNDPSNWTPAIVPGDPFGGGTDMDRVTFGASDTAAITIGNNSVGSGITINDLTFEQGSNAFTYTLPGSTFTMQGAGITNDSNSIINFVTYFGFNGPGQLGFTNSATAGGASIHITNNGGRTLFNAASTAGIALIVNNGSTPTAENGSTVFNGGSAGAATIINNNIMGSGAGFTEFYGGSASSANITNNGGGFASTHTVFFNVSTAGNASLIANGGTGGQPGGVIKFFDSSTGGTSRVGVFGNGTGDATNGSLDISYHNPPGVAIGSIEGNGAVFLGGNILTVGSNNLNTTFSGVIQDGEFAKIGSGILTFQGRATNNYIAATASLSLVTGSIINLNFSGTPDTIGELFVNGVLQTRGLYGGPASGAPHQLPEFAGTGTVQVTMGPIPTPTPTPTSTPTPRPTATPTPTAPAPTPTPTPAVTTNPATNVASFSATLNGSLNPRGSTTTVYFQYGLTTSYGSTTPMQTQTGNTVRGISANISGLSASHLYHFRIVAHNAGGTSFGSDRTFTTLSATGPPVVTTNPATFIASFSATLNGSLDPHGLTTNVYFQYGTTTGYGLTTAMQTQTGNTFRNVSANISGLSASTVYHFRIVATNSAGTRYGSDRTFTTLSATGPPVVTTNPATLIASFSATLNGSLDPHGLTTNVYFQYGTTTSYGLTTAPQNHSGNTYQNISANISSLSANTVYHFRIVATNSTGTTYGADRTFTTLSATGAPVVTTSPATNITSSLATLNGSLDPHGLTTNVYFQYGTANSYGLTTAPQSQNGNTYRNVSANISGLTTHTTYHFRIVATNNAGTRFGGDRTFTTP